MRRHEVCFHKFPHLLSIWWSFNLFNTETVPRNQATPFNKSTDAFLKVKHPLSFSYRNHGSEKEMQLIMSFNHFVMRYKGVVGRDFISHTRVTSATTVDTPKNCSGISERNSSVKGKWWTVYKQTMPPLTSDIVSINLSVNYPNTCCRPNSFVVVFLPKNPIIILFSILSSLSLL